jgi:hypothetical protein
MTSCAFSGLIASVRQEILFRAVIASLTQDLRELCGFRHKHAGALDLQVSSPHRSRRNW